MVVGDSLIYSGETETKYAKTISEEGIQICQNRLEYFHKEKYKNTSCDWTLPSLGEVQAPSKNKENIENIWKLESRNLTSDNHPVKKP